MKKYNKWFIALFAIFISSVIAGCTDPVDDDNVGDISYTNLEGIDIEALDSCDYTIGSFTIDAPGNWRVESDKMWLTLTTDTAGVFVSEERGVKGVYTIYVKVTNTGREFADATANVKLIANDKEFVVATIVRPAKDYELALLSSDGKPIDKIDFGHSKVVDVRIEANYDCAVVEYPQWLEEPVVKNGNYSFGIVADSIPLSCYGKIVVSDVTSTITRTFDICYDGMDPRHINVSSENGTWWWSVSVDGKTFKKSSQDGLNDSGDVLVQDFLTAAVTCRHYDYRLFFVEETVTKDDSLVYSYKKGDEAWIKGKIDENRKDDVMITVEPSVLKVERTGYLFAVPVAMCDSFEVSVNEPDSVSIVDLFVNNVVAHVVQEGVVEEGGEEEDIDPDACVITDSDGNVTYSVVEQDYDMHVYVLTEFFQVEGEIEEAVTNDKNVVSCELEIGKRYSINTKVTGSSRKVALQKQITMGQWQEIVNSTWKEGNLEGDDLSAFKAWGLNFAVKDDGFWHLDFTVPESWNFTLLDENDPSKGFQPIVARIYRGTSINLKVIVIRIKNTDNE